MKIHLPQSLVKALIATFAIGCTSSQVQAQETPPVHTWSMEELEAFYGEMDTLTSPTFEIWENIIEAAGIPNAEGDKVFKIPTGSSVITNDGLVTLTEDIYIKSGGTLCDAEGKIIVDANNKYDAFRNNIILNADIPGTDFKAGEIVMGSIPAALGGSVPNMGYFAAQNPSHALAGGLSGSQIKIDQTARQWTSATGTSAVYPSIHGGKLGSSFGTPEAPVETKIFITNTNRAITTQLENVFGGNSLDSAPSSALSGNADFTGNSSILVYSDYADSIYIESVVGGNKAFAPDTKTYTAHFNGDTNIALMYGAEVYRVVGGNSIYTEASLDTTNPLRDKITANFNGDSYILINEGSKAGIVVGGNYGNGLNSSVGSVENKSTTRIDITEGADVEGVVGASFVTYKSDTSFIGDTHVNISSRINSISTVFGYEHAKAMTGIKGGFSSYSDTMLSDGISLEGATATLKGDTNVKIDFANPTKSDAFVLAITGGSFATHGLNVEHVGTANLTITNVGKTEFTGIIVGGNMNADSDLTDLNEAPGISHSSADQSSMSINKVVVNVDGGMYGGGVFNSGLEFQNSSLFTVGSNTQSGGSVHTGETIANITGGHFRYLVGGNSATVSIAPIIPQGLGSTEYDSTTGATSVGSVNINFGAKEFISPEVSGEKVPLVQTLVGGSFIDDRVTHIVGDNATINTQALSVGDVNINIKNAGVGNVIGGSYVGASITAGTPQTEGGAPISYTGTQGNIKISFGENTYFLGGYVAAAGVLAVTEYPHEASNAFNNSFENQLYTSLYTAMRDTRYNHASFEVTDTPLSYTGVTGELLINLPFTMETDSTHVDLSSKAYSDSLDGTIISGDYMIDTSQIEAPDISDSESITGQLRYYKNQADSWLENNSITQAEADAMYQAINEWEAAYEASAAKLPDIVYDHQSIVVGNRLLSLNDGVYENLAGLNFIEFDEIAIDSGSVVDFSMNGQDLDAFNGRNILDGTKATTPFKTTEGVHTTGTNTLRKTGDGTLKLNAINGQIGTEDNLQFVVEGGTVVLAKESADITQSNFKTFVLQKGATLNMRAGNHDVITGKFESGNAGINGDLLLEVGSILQADASRDTVGSGLALEGGSVNIIGDGKITLQFDNMHLALVSQIAEEGHLLFDAATLYFEIVLFSELNYLDGVSTNLEFDITGGTFDGVDAKGVLASKYFESNLGLDNVYLVYNANGDMVLTGANLVIPEPSTATLSLLALTALLSRRRRKAA